MISLRHPFRPFSHIPGTMVLIPGSSFVLQPFPALLRAFMYKEDGLVLHTQIPFDSGPLEQFTIMQDLEKGCVAVSGKREKGFLRYEIWNAGDKVLLQKPTIPSYIPPKTRLSFGCHKQQDWNEVCRRNDMTEILPFWFWLAQTIPQGQSELEEGTQLFTLQEAIQRRETLKIVPILIEIFLNGFSGILVPDMREKYLGYREPCFTHRRYRNPLDLFSASCSVLRSLFFQEEHECWDILPCLPPQFHAGKIINIMAQKGSKVSIEWTKKRMRRVIIETGEPLSVMLRFPKRVQRFRLQSDGVKEQLPNNYFLSLNPQSRYLLDTFTK